jgi:hypothetical protein
MKDNELRTLPELIEFIKAESDSQIKKWGIQDLASSEWILIFNEEVGELNKAVLENWFADVTATNEALINIYNNVFHEAI